LERGHRRRQLAGNFRAIVREVCRHFVRRRERLRTSRRVRGVRDWLKPADARAELGDRAPARLTMETWAHLRNDVRDSSVLPIPRPMPSPQRSHFSPVSRREFLGRLSLGAAGVALASTRLGAEGTGERKLGVALCGLGRYATNELGPALKLTQHCRLAGVITGSPDKGRKMAADYGFPEKNIYSYETMHQLADNRDIDIVYVVTPNGIHAQNAIAAAKAGKHVITEKPMANTVAECDAMIAACQSANVKLSVGYRLHFDPYHQEMMRLAHEKDFGAFMKMTGNRGFVARERLWRQVKKLSGGGPMMDLGIYINQGAVMAADGVMPVAVTAKHIPTTKPDIFVDVEEGTNWTMEFPNGAVCEAFTSYNHSSDTFRAEGNKGWIEFKQKAFTYRGAVVETSRGPLKFDPPVNQQARQIDDFARCIREGRESRVSGVMGRRDLAIIEAIYASAAQGGKKVAVKA
jgi:glucose-fructose oxidoreductase